MRHPWRSMLLLRSHIRRASSPHVLPQSQVHSQSNFLHSLCSIRTDTHHPKFPISHFTNPLNPRTNLISRNLTTDPSIDGKDPDHKIIAEIFSRPRDVDEYKKELESNNVTISHEYVLSVLKCLQPNPDVSRRFFDWVLCCEGKRLSSKSYNLMLGTFGVNGCVKEFWDLVEVMKKKGYGVEKWVHDAVLEKFEKDGLVGDAERLRAVYASGSIDNSVEKVCSRVCKIVRNKVWSDDVEKKLGELNMAFSSDMVKMVLGNIATEPMKALIFFRWIEEGGFLKHDQQTYNAMATVLGREDCLDRFWKVVEEMRSKGYEMELETYVKVFGTFCKGKLITDAVDLYEFAMAGKNKPYTDCCTFLLKKIVVAKELDMGLFSRVVRVYTENGNALTNSMLNAVLKSLNSVARHGECDKVFNIMAEGGLVANANLQNRIAFQLGRAGKKIEASQFISPMEVSGADPNHKAWASLIEGYCVAGDLDKASNCLQEMMKNEGGVSVAYALELMVTAYCRKNSATDAYIFLSSLVSERKLKPWQTTYKLLISKLLAHGEFRDALTTLVLMKNDGYPPFIDPFIEHVSKTGTGDDAIAFLKAMASRKEKEFPSTIVFLQVFEAYFKAGRRSEAQNFLSKCPSFIRSHADVLNLFCPVKSGDDAATNAVAA